MDKTLYNNIKLLICQDQYYGLTRVILTITSEYCLYKNKLCKYSINKYIKYIRICNYEYPIDFLGCDITQEFFI